MFTIEDTAHDSIAPCWTGSESQIKFFERLGERLYLIEEKWVDSRAA